MSRKGRRADHLCVATGAGKKAGEICREIGVTFAGVLQLSSGVTVKLNRIPVVRENVVQNHRRLSNQYSW
jgi:hypothetical protein